MAWKTICSFLCFITKLCEDNEGSVVKTLHSAQCSVVMVGQVVIYFEPLHYPRVVKTVKR